jgi:hypothetical protein
MVYQRQGQRSTQNYQQQKKYKEWYTNVKANDQLKIILWPWRWYTILYIVSVVDNFELIIGFGVGIPFFIFFLL